MRVFMVGATGALGRRLATRRREHGHEVNAPARTAENERPIRSMGGGSEQADLFDAASRAYAAEGVEVVIHAATAIPLGGWSTNDRICREGIRALAEAAASAGATVDVQQSVRWVATAARTAFGADERAATRLSPSPRRRMWTPPWSWTTCSKSMSCRASARIASGASSNERGAALHVGQEERHRPAWQLGHALDSCPQGSDDQTTRQPVAYLPARRQSTPGHRHGQ